MLPATFVQCRKNYQVQPFFSPHILYIENLSHKEKDKSNRFYRIIHCKYIQKFQSTIEQTEWKGAVWLIKTCRFYGTKMTTYTLIEAIFIFHSICFKKTSGLLAQKKYHMYLNDRRLLADRNR